MPRSTAQRLGDVAVLLAAVAVLSFLSRVAAAVSIGGEANSAWSFLGLSVTSALLPAFAAACVACWMDERRRALLRPALLALFGACALAVIGDVAFGGTGFGAGGRSASFLQDAASLLMVAGGITLISGFLPSHDG